MYVVFPGLIFFVLFARKIKPYKRMFVELPVCDGCVVAEKFTPQRVDFENLKMQFVVHEAFIKEMTIDHNKRISSRPMAGV